MVITKREAENLIIETYSQFAAPLQKLYALMPKDNQYQLNYEQRQIADLYKQYCDAYGIMDISGNIGEIVRQQLSADLQISGNDEIAETLIECRDLARLFELPIYNEIPKGEMAVNSYNFDGKPNFRIISDIPDNIYSGDKSIEVGSLVTYTVERINSEALSSKSDYVVEWDVINDPDFFVNNMGSVINNVSLEVVNAIDVNKWNRCFIAKYPGFHIIVAEIFIKNGSEVTPLERVEYIQRVNYYKWNSKNLFTWKIIPERFGGGIPYIQRFKDGWVKYNKRIIIENSQIFSFPPELLAGVCWIEVGGDPNFIDKLAFETRAFDWSGPEIIDNNLTITKPPQNTSFGSVSIQLRTAAQTMGLDVSQLTIDQYRELYEALQNDVFNINIVARHIRELIDHDKLQESPPLLDMESIRIVGARYNRGLGLSIENIQNNTSYGDFIVSHWERFRELLK